MDHTKKIPLCMCKGCKEERARIIEFIENPFLNRVDAVRKETKYKQIEKAAKKYFEPFNPDSWTAAELGNHANEEIYDLGVYVTGLTDRAVDLESRISTALDILNDCMVLEMNEYLDKDLQQVIRILKGKVKK